MPTKWVRVSPGKYTFGGGAVPRFTVVNWGEGAKPWELKGAEIIGRTEFASLKAAKEFAALVMRQAQAEWEAEHRPAS